MNRREQIEVAALNACQAADAYSIPVQPELVARNCSIDIEYKGFSDELSGVLVKNPEGAVIGVNSQHSRTRKRFTISHELGHFILGHAGKVFIDKHSINKRDSSSAFAVDVHEIEANQFAASLLMPRDLVLNSLNRLYTEELTRDEIIKALARLFEVSGKAMEYRLMNLGLIHPSDDEAA